MSYQDDSRNWQSNTTQDQPRECLLLVDDNPTNLQVLYQTLDGRKYRLLAAKDGEQALAIVERARPDMLLLDIMMPGLDGFQVCERLKANPETNDIAVIFLSALDDTKDKVRGLELGAVDYISKPFQADEVIARVDTHLKIRRLEQSLYQHNKELETVNRRMRKDLQAAARVQQALLPHRLPATARAEFAWKYRPCDELGGDGLNVFQIDDQHVGMYILDVCGHGVPAALLAVTVMHQLSPALEPSMSLLVASAGTKQPYTLVSPAQIAQRLNKMYPMDPESRLYFTFLYGILDTSNYQFRYISAGNPGPVLARSGQRPMIFDAPAVPIGLLEDSYYEDSLLTLQPGDRLYLHSDGLVEERNDTGEEYGRERLKQAVADSHRPMGLEQSMQLFIDEAIKWGGKGKLKDDASIVALQINESEDFTK